MSFLMGIKSTVDFIAATIATDNGLALGNLDSPDAYEVVLSSELDTIVWELGAYTEAPSDPLYDIEFFIGAKTVQDAGGYTSTTMLQHVLEKLPVGSTSEVRDYSGAAASGEIGMLFVVTVELEPQMMDKHAGIRMVRIHARCQSYI